MSLLRPSFGQRVRELRLAAGLNRLIQAASSAITAVAVFEIGMW